MMHTAGMRGMLRKQVYIDAVQGQYLKRRAAELGVTEAELIRQAINLPRLAPDREPFDPDAWVLAGPPRSARSRIPNLCRRRPPSRLRASYLSRCVIQKYGWDVLQAPTRPDVVRSLSDGGIAESAARGLGRGAAL